ncbi:MAG: SDR family NAD(P)-dependent oxidoreductase [Gemmatimonadota bacterium]
MNRGPSPFPTVLITGGAGHLGRHVVQRFLEGGARVDVPLFRGDEASIFVDLLGQVPEALEFHEEVDLSKSESVDRVLARIRERDGAGPGVLLNLAGGFAMDILEETDPGTWEQMWQRNATSAFLSSRAVFPEMKSAGWGRIVNVSALPALDRGKPGLSAYGAAKAAVLNLTYSLAKEGVKHGITANAILPSIIDTPPNRESNPDADRSTWLPPSEIASVLHFLASDEARIVNGAAIPLTLG